MRIVLSCLVALVLIATPSWADEEVEGATNSYILTASESQNSDLEIDQTSVSTGVSYSLELACQRGEGITGPDFYGCGSAACGDSGDLFNVWAYYSDRANEIVDVRCLEPSEVPAAVGVTPGLALRAFERVPLPASRVVVQPPGGETLVNLDTIFSTEADGFTRTVRLLGRRVELDITASEFRWVHGDGSALRTDWAGKPWRRGTPIRELITHRYEDSAESLSVRVDTTWSARYRVGTGPWRDVPGTVTITGEPFDLAVLSASPYLAG